MSTLTKGRRVHYFYQGQCYIADVVQTWSATTANLVLTLDGSNDRVLGGTAEKFQVWKTSVPHSDVINDEGMHQDDSTWHWPERTD